MVPSAAISGPESGPISLVERREGKRGREEIGREGERKREERGRKEEKGREKGRGKKRESREREREREENFATERGKDPRARVAEGNEPQRVLKQYCGDSTMNYFVPPGIQFCNFSSKLLPTSA